MNSFSTACFVTAGILLVAMMGCAPANEPHYESDFKAKQDAPKRLGQKVIGTLDGFEIKKTIIDGHEYLWINEMVFSRGFCAIEHKADCSFCKGDK